MIVGPDDADFYDEEPDDTCPNCGGEGFVACCMEEWACIDPEGGCDDCTRRCDWCNPTGKPADLDADDLGTRAEEIIGKGQICDRCGATLYTYTDTCTATLDDPCPGFLAIEAGRAKAREALPTPPKAEGE